MKRIWAIACILSLMCLAPVIFPAAVAVSAQTADDAFARFTKDSYPDTEAAIAALAASGAPTAEAALEALGDGRLLFDPASGAVLIKAKDGSTLDARTGAAIANPPAGLKQVRLNNRVRRTLEAAMGSLTLMSSDAAKRRQAAEAVFKSRDPAALATVDKALAREMNPSIRKALLQAQAAIRLVAPGTSDADRMEAIDTIGERGDQDALGLLRSLPADASPAVKQAADSAIKSIESRLALLANVQNAWYGISLGSVLLLAAIGLAITFGVMGIINMAHGEMVMLGAYTTYVVQEVCRSRFPGLFDYSLTIALPLAFLVAGGVGALIERGIIRFLYGRPLETLLATWGVSLILQQAIRSIFGPTNKEVGAPSYMSGAFDLGGLSITYGRLWIVLFSFAVFGALLLTLKATPFGLRMRAVTQNRRMAASMGIRTPWIDTMAFALGSGIAGIAGVALSQIDNVSPNLGQSYIVDSFLVVVFGGVGNLWGTLVAALTLGVANKFLEPYAGAVLGKILLLVFIILFIQKKPRGLFALKGRFVDA